MKEQKKYLRKLWVLFLVLTMVVSMMPTMAFAAGEGEEPTEITTAEEFAAMKADGNYRLANDITVTEPYKSTFKGTFDGDGNTVNLNINVTSGNAGLFSETGSGAVIRNVNVHADVTSSVASTSYGTGGLIGKVNYPATIENCEQRISRLCRRIGGISERYAQLEKLLFCRGRDQQRDLLFLFRRRIGGKRRKLCNYSGELL